MMENLNEMPPMTKSTPVITPKPGIVPPMMAKIWSNKGSKRPKITVPKMKSGLFMRRNDSEKVVSTFEFAPR